MTDPLTDRDREYVERVLHRLRLGEGFHFDILIVPDAMTATAVLDAIAATSPLERVCFERDASDPARTFLAAFQATIERPGPPLAVMAAAYESSDREAWTYVFHRLNEYRNGITRKLGRPLLFVVHPELEVLLAHEAPDLWSVRSGVERFEGSRREPGYFVAHPTLWPLEGTDHDVDRARHGVAQAGPLGELAVASARIALARALLSTDRAHDALVELDEAVPIVARAAASGALDPLSLDAALEVSVRAHERAGRLGDAERLTSERVDALRAARALDSRQVPSLHLSGALQAHGVLLVQRGRLEDALAAHREAVALLRQPYAENPSLIGPSYCAALANLAATELLAGARAQGLKTAEAAVHEGERLYAEGGRIFANQLLTALKSLASAFVMTGDSDAALRVARRGVEVARDLGEPDTLRSRELVAGAWLHLARALFRAGRAREAQQPAFEAVKHLRTLYRLRPEVFWSELSEALLTLADVLGATGLLDLARAALTEASDLLWPAFERDPAAHRDRARRILLFERSNLAPTLTFSSRLARYTELTGETL